MAPSAKISAPVTEKGYANSFPGSLSAYSQWDMFEQVPELLWPESVRTYTRMMREDARIASVLGAIGLPIRGSQWRIDPNGAKKKVVKLVSQSLGLPIVGGDDNAPTGRTKGKFSWTEHLQKALLCLVYGHAIFEQVYELADGQLYLKKLAPRPSSTIALWDVDRAGELLAIEQWPMGMALGAVPGSMSSASNPIPASRLVVYVRDPDPGSWIGNSLLRAAYKHWLLKDELIRIEAATARRNGMGVPVAYSREDEAAAGEPLDKYQVVASSYRGGNSAGVAMPGGSKLELLGVQGNLPDMRLAIEYHDKQMALVAMAHFLNLDRGGSYALASIQADTFTQAVQSVANMIRDVAQAHIIEDLVDVNFGPDEPAPRLVVDEIGSRQDGSAAALQLLQSAGILTPDPQLEAFERQQMGLPPLPADHTSKSDQTVDEPADDPLTVPIDTVIPPTRYRGAEASARRWPDPSAGRRYRQPVTISPNGDMTLW